MPSTITYTPNTYTQFEGVQFQEQFSTSPPTYSMMTPESIQYTHDAYMGVPITFALQQSAQQPRQQQVTMLPCVSAMIQPVALPHVTPIFSSSLC